MVPVPTRRKVHGKALVPSWWGMVVAGDAGAFCCSRILGGGNSNIFLEFSPRKSWGFMIQFDVRIFFKWVGEKPPNYRYCIIF